MAAGEGGPCYPADPAGLRAPPVVPRRPAPLPALERGPGNRGRADAHPASAAGGDQGPPWPHAAVVREIADYLLLQSHSAVGLVDRAEAAGVVRRRPDATDARIVRVELTERGDRLVTQLTEAHLVEMFKLAEALGSLLPEWWTASPPARRQQAAGGARA